MAYCSIVNSDGREVNGNLQWRRFEDAHYGGDLRLGTSDGVIFLKILSGNSK